MFLTRVKRRKITVKGIVWGILLSFPWQQGAILERETLSSRTALGEKQEVSEIMIPAGSTYWVKGAVGITNNPKKISSFGPFADWMRVLVDPTGFPNPPSLYRAFKQTGQAVNGVAEIQVKEGKSVEFLDVQFVPEFTFSLQLTVDKTKHRQSKHLISILIPDPLNKMSKSYLYFNFGIPPQKIVKNGWVIIREGTGRKVRVDDLEISIPKDAKTDLLMFATENGWNFKNAKHSNVWVVDLVPDGEVIVNGIQIRNNRSDKTKSLPLAINDEGGVRLHLLPLHDIDEIAIPPGMTATLPTPSGKPIQYINKTGRFLSLELVQNRDGSVQIYFISRVKQIWVKDGVIELHEPDPAPPTMPFSHFGTGRIAIVILSPEAYAESLLLSSL